MSHLIRVGFALGLAFAAFMTLRVLVLQGELSEPRLALVAPRQEANEARWAAKTARFSDAQTCAGSNCHQDTYDEWSSSAHGGVNCETCHGAAREHRDRPEVPVLVDLGAELCTLCHAQVQGRPDAFPQVEAAAHYPETTCGSCHVAHEPGPPRAVTHEVTPGSDCISCHSRTAPPDRDVPVDHAERTNSQCLTCHERRTG